MKCVLGMSDKQTMAFSEKRQRHARQSTSVVGDTCPTICKLVHTHAQWRLCRV